MNYYYDNNSLTNSTEFMSKTSIEREGEVSAHLRSLETISDELDRAIASFAQKLQPVLTPDRPTTSGVEETITHPIPLCEALSQRIKHLSYLIATVRDLHERTAL